jgi:SAM-dependent methyltransferase
MKDESLHASRITFHASRLTKGFYMSDHGNLQKHLNANRAQQFLIDRFHRQIVALVRQTAVSHLLDSGCGEGFVLDYFRRGGLDVTAVGADLRLEALHWAKNNLLPDLNGTVADIHRLPFPDNSFPLVMSLEVLEHIPDSGLGLRELLRVSSRYILISVPHEPLFRGANFLRGKHLNRWGNDPEHLHNYNGRAFRQLVSRQATVIAHHFAFPWQIILAQK